MNNKNNLQFPVPSVRAIILNEKSEILFLKRAINDSYGGKWCLPGGKVDYGMSIEQALVNEVKEETNLDASETKFLFYLDGLPDEEYKDHYIIFYFECKVRGEIELNDESSEFVWINKSNLRRYNIAFKNDLAIEKYFLRS
jgi:8-oxo-dGTP diphosphatase